MCGICGRLYFDPEQPVSEDSIDRMMDRLRHRGPDSSGKYTGHHIGMGFTRLSIIDPEHGDQPLYSEDRSIVLVCNGEIFNYPELRRAMKARGYSFSTGSDVEVIIPLYQEYGFDLFDRLNGQ